MRYPKCAVDMSRVSQDVCTNTNYFLAPVSSGGFRISDLKSHWKDPRIHILPSMVDIQKRFSLPSNTCLILW